ncbi:hypothetical protein HY768_04320 [candidate division TA06 bacterium]|uniref:Uncharacterized protein n=1 Tax=candidate division TA06 bacterium TaxID=2250710 RepID=A0A933I877_UNCT6|nr:hypothetical protein [candidate division TA06 bacterium]
MSKASLAPALARSYWLSEICTSLICSRLSASSLPSPMATDSRRQRSRSDTARSLRPMLLLTTALP